MKDQIVWELCDADLKEIQDLYEKKQALENLKIIIGTENAELTAKWGQDYQEAVSDFDSWWKRKSQEYKWKGQQWYIDFVSREVKEKSI